MAKLKFQGNFKDLILQHGEKAVLSAILLVVLMMTWSAISREGIPEAKTPDKIESLASQAKRVMGNATESTINPKTVQVRPELQVIDISKYKLEIGLDNDIHEKSSKRGDPALFAVSELEVSTGSGPFAYEAGFGTEGRDEADKPQGKPWPESLFKDGFKVDSKKHIVRGTRWIVVKGLIPIKKQKKEYFDTFSKSIGYDISRDKPEYLGYFIERAELGPNGTVDWSSGEKVTVHQGYLNRVIKSWGGVMPPLTNDENIDPVLTHPLGPRMLVAWSTREVLHSKIPARSEQTKGEEQRPPERVVEEPGFGGFGETPEKKPVVEEAKSGEEDSEVEHVMFRYFDFTAKPNVTYKYRVQLVLKDVNFPRKVSQPMYSNYQPAVAARLRKLINSGKDKNYRMTSWSQPSPSVEIAESGNLLAGKVTPSSTSARKEPEVNVLVQAFDPSRSSYVTSEKIMKLGMITNFQATGQALDAAYRMIVDVDNYPFKTNKILVDLRGGEKLSTRDRNFYSPTEVVFTDLQGKLHVHRELDDRSRFDEQQKILKGASTPTEGPTPDAPSGKPRGLDL